MRTTARNRGGTDSRRATRAGLPEVRSTLGRHTSVGCNRSRPGDWPAGRTVAVLGASVLCATILSGAAPSPGLAQEAVPIVFPVAGSHSYTDDFGAPRSGGRAHQGIDIFAAKLTPIVAAEDGRISWWILDEGSAGYMLELVGRSGYRYWYIHLNNDTPGTDDGRGGLRWAFAVGIEPGAPVRKGQRLGYVGDSGNAEWTRPHLHFEIHTADGVPINPYPSLRTATHFVEPDPSQGFAFHEYLTLQNPGDQTVTASPTYLLNGAGTRRGGDVVLPPRSRKTVRVNDEVPRTEHGSVVVATGPIVVERPMYFQYGDFLWTGGHVGVGLPSPRTEFYFAEGYTGPTFEEYLTVANPTTSDASVSIDYLIERGGNRRQRLTVPAGTRATVNVKAVIGVDKQVSAVVRSDVPVVAERPMYFSYGSEGWTGGHVSSGLERPSTSFYFAEGYTAQGFDQWLTVGNPNETTATVLARFLRDRAGPISHSFRVGPLTRKTFFVPALIGRGYENSLELTSDLPILAERPMYFYSRAWEERLGPISGGTVVAGLARPATERLFAEGYTGPYFQEYITIGNPNPTPASVTLEYHGNGGLIQASTYTVRAASRFTVDVNADAGHGRELSVKVVASQPVVAERPMYFRYQGIWTDGHTSLGAEGALPNWQFGEGYTG